MKGNVKGRLRNMKLPKSRSLDTVMEAVVNSIQSIESMGDVSNGIIKIKIIYKNIQTTLDGPTISIVTGFEIKDNGIGFNHENYSSFDEFDSTHKLNIGGKGIGRLLWLKAFDYVIVDSIYEENDCCWRRKIKFVPDDKFEIDTNEQISNMEKWTTVSLVNCKKEFEEVFQVNAETLSKKILSHCISYFVNNMAPKIIINDKEGNCIVNELYDEIKDTKFIDEFEINDKKFSIIHIRFYNLTPYKDEVIYCANGWSVKSEVPEIFKSQSLIDDSGKKFRYNAFISSPYFDETVNAERSDFSITERTTTTVYDPNEILMPTIRDKAEILIKSYLENYTKNATILRNKRADSFVEENPMFSIVLKYDPDIKSEIDLDADNNRLYSLFNNRLAKLESSIIMDVTNPINIKETLDVSEEIEKRLVKVQNVQKANLTKYILQRKYILELYEKGLEGKLRQDGNFKYQTEEYLHNLLLPKKIENDEITISNCNLWILDDRLNYYAYREHNAVSDKELYNFTTSNSETRPDIVVYSESSIDGTNAANVAIIELKRPDRKDKEVADQVRGYIRKIKDNSIIDHKGKKIMVTNNTRFYCYILCDLSKSNILDDLREDDWQELYDNLGFCKWFTNLNAYIEFIDYNKLVTDAKRRNSIFFEIIKTET